MERQYIELYRHQYSKSKRELVQDCLIAMDSIPGITDIQIEDEWEYKIIISYLYSEPSFDVSDTVFHRHGVTRTVCDSILG